ncbi:peptidoglycan editing factor PgeF [Bacillus sp. 2205SS5-2]|uniref:peptidoglycan editing factor PgeF n=1 Tax=Bacillus sp. 2205SS5-2 TaxID=3109031 RepID=UPI00300477C2
MEPFTRYGKKTFILSSWMENSSSLIAGFTTKEDGTSLEPYSSLNLGFHVGDQQNLVVENREKVAEEIGFPLSLWVGAEQTHGDQIQEIPQKHLGRGAENYTTSLKGTDGLYSAEKGLLLTLAFADCVPIYFFAPKSHLIGIVHAGWKGTIGQIALKMVDKWASMGVAMSDIQAIIGPSICKNCYKVDDKVIKEIDKIVTNIDETYYTVKDKGQYLLDLKQVNHAILLNSGLCEENIVTSSLCTSCHSSSFFSHRRDRGKTGRMLGFIGWKESS